MLLKEELAPHRGAPVIVGEDRRLRHAAAALRRAAATDTPVLLQGETGTGKKLFARALHLISSRADRPFVSIDCAGPVVLVESALFGGQKHPTEDSASPERRQIEVARHGTLFLDHVGDLPSGLQAKMLWALKEWVFEPFAEEISPRTNVRIAAATSRNLGAAVASGQFNEDLFFRLSVFPIGLPPLRERLDDIPVLAEHFIERTSRKVNKQAPALAAETLKVLKKYHWPGNVRELKNCMECAVILADGDTIFPRHMSLSFAPADEDPWDRIDLSGTLAEASVRILEEVERRKIREALHQTSGDKVRASDILKVSYKTLVGKLRKYRLDAQ